MRFAKCGLQLVHRGLRYRRLKEAKALLLERLDG
jgi:hypothetical protein